MIDHIRLLIADRDADAARVLGKELVRQGYFCELARTVASALTTLARVACDVVICDVRMEPSEDFELLDKVKLSYPRLPVIILTHSGSTAEAVAAIKHGAFEYLIEPCSVDELHRHIHQAIADDQQLRRRFSSVDAGASSGEIVHESTVMKALMETIALVALSLAPVLIVGETGTGKERIARAIHARGPRRSRPFVPVNTSAIPDQLLESELFGHVRGAYTGALSTRLGLLGEANGGTLLLDEIGDMPMALQPKILRTLQFGEARAVGSDRERHVDVRIIAATHRELAAQVSAGLFRDDLRYRLNTLTLRIPPLRERREDIGPLVRQFLLAARSRTPWSPVTTIAPDAMLLLAAAPWPGNIRELESAIERVVILGREATVAARDFSFLEGPTAMSSETWPQLDGRHYTLRQMNQRYLHWVLEQTAGDKTRAAELLGIDVSTLYRWQRAKN